jgi:hypothetical protein
MQSGIQQTKTFAKKTKKRGRQADLFLIERGLKTIFSSGKWLRSAAGCGPSLAKVG